MSMRLVAVVAGLFSSYALACSCGRTLRIFPSSGLVPTNFVIQATTNGGSVQPLMLFDQDQGVPLDVAEHTTSWVTLRPARPLAPRTTYRLLNSEGAELESFTTTDGPDNTPPAPRALSKTTREATSGPCGDFESVTLELEPGEQNEPTALLVFTGETNTSRALEGDARAFTIDSRLVNSACETNFPLLTTPNVAIAVRTIDVAGNVSELSTAKQAKSGGCSSSAELLIILAVAVFRRRR
ncbi:MAG: hypothetical protein JNM17_31565 [Archangium sp.]|nr:hypothetical protein [Archangium sp.]